MALKIVILCLLSATVCVNTFPFDGVSEEMPTLVCSNGFHGANPTIATKLKMCKDPSVYGVGPGKKSPGCSYFCMARALDLLGPDGLPHPDISNRWVDKDFPPKYKQLAMNHIRSCYNQYGSSIDLSDEKCTMAGAYNKCFWELQPKLIC